MDFNQRWALVTGASSGLGVAFARELASQGARLILVARRESPMQALAEELREAHGTEVHVRAQDLARPDAAESLHHWTEENGLTVDILVNNAGFGQHGPFQDIPWEREAAMLQLDIVTLVQLTRLYADDMRRRGQGRILQVASLAAYLPTPTYASYAAAKAFVLNHGEAVNRELKGTGVACTVVSPGVTATEFLETAGQHQPSFYQRMVMMQAPAVARVGIRAMRKGRSSVVPGVLNKLTAWSARLMPRTLQARVAELCMRL